MALADRPSKVATRSRAYPAIDLREAVDALHRISSSPRAATEHDRDDIARAFGYTGGSSGIAGRKIAALTHFGLLEGSKGRYALTDLARLVLNPPSKQRLQGALEQAVLHVPLFAEIIDTYRLRGCLPRPFANALKAHGITESAKAEVARNFAVSAEYAGILAADGVFLDDSQASGHTVKADESPQSESAISEEESLQVIRFPLTDRKRAEIHVSQHLNENDLELIRLQVKFLEDLVKVNQVAPTLSWHRKRKSR